MTWRSIIVSIGLTLFLGCATTQDNLILTEEEVVRREESINNELANRFESQIKFKEDKEVTVYLRSIAEALAQASPQLRNSPVGVWLIQARNKKWESFSIPGNRLYICSAVLKNLEYENQIAALLALQMGHLIHNQMLKKLDEELEPPKKIATKSIIDPTVNESTKKFKKKDLKLLSSPRGREFVRLAQFFGPNGLFSYNDDENIEAIQGAVEVLYNAGYDSRGLISLLELFRDKIKYSPYEPSVLNKMIEQTRYEIAQFAPLRNPIVRSQAFFLIQKRFHRL